MAWRAFAGIIPSHMPTFVWTSRRRAAAFGLGVLLGLAVALPTLAHVALDEQVGDLSRRIQDRPDDASLYLRRGELHRIRREWDAALSDYATARRLDSRMASVDLCLGRLLLETGRPAEARAALDRFLSRRPDHAEGLAFRARSLEMLGDHLAAAADLTRAIERYRPPERPRPEYYLDRARALMAAGPTYLDEALHGLDEGLERLGEPVTLALSAIELEVKAGRHGAALARLDRTASRAARKEIWLSRRAEILERAGRLDEARRCHEQTLEAIESLTVSRRGSAAVLDLESSARAALRRLTPEHPAPCAGVAP